MDLPDPEGPSMQVKLAKGKRSVTFFSVCALQCSSWSQSADLRLKACLAG